MNPIQWLFTGDEFYCVDASGGGEQGDTPAYCRFRPSNPVNETYDGPATGPLGFYDEWTSVGLPDSAVFDGIGDSREPRPNWALYHEMRRRNWRLGESILSNGRAFIRNVYERRGDDWIAIGQPVVYIPNDVEFGIVMGVLMSIATAGAASQIGTAIIGAELAASYPVLANAVGTVAVNTVATGGDVEGAVRGAVTGLASGYIGQNVAAGVDSVAAGRAASAAVNAAIRNGDIRGAVGQSLLLSAVESGGDMFADSWGASQAVSDYGYGVDAGIVPIDPGPYVDPIYPDFATDPTAPITYDYVFDGTTTTGYQSPAPDSGIVGIDTPIYTSTPPVVIDDGSPVDFGRGAIDFLTQAAIAAIKVNAAYQATQRPPVRVNTNPASGTPTATTGGMLVTRNPITGAMQTARPPVGTPYVLADGRTMINNGDGTFSLIAPNGSVSRVPYAGATSNTDATNWLLYGALGLGAFALLRK